MSPAHIGARGCSPRFRGGLFELLEFLSAHLSGKPVKAPVDVEARPSDVSATPPRLNVSLVVNCQRLDRTRPSIDLWSTLLVLGLQAAIVELMAPSGPCHSVFCLLIQPIHWQLLCEDLMGGSFRGLTKIQGGDVHCSPLFCQPVIHHIRLSGYLSMTCLWWVCVDAPGGFLVFHVLGNGFQG